ncbi:MAG TPA: helix-turn-helix domain-containing protein [Gammaproteobacteria bacterium]|nr:helix-turn-helix domain-containing protein [Gammaproteobacteria bacterium]
MLRMTIGTLAAASGVKVTTIRYYERAGLMPAPPRTTGGQRDYTREHHQLLQFICKARELDFSIDEIRTLLVLSNTAQMSCREVQHLAGAHVERLRHRIAILVKLEARLTGAIAQCSGDQNSHCPVLNLLSLPSAPVENKPLESDKLRQ